MDNPPQKGAGKGYYLVVFTLYQARPYDFDNAFIKPWVDALRYAQVIPGDDATICDGTVFRIKVSKRCLQKTVIEIYYQPI